MIGLFQELGPCRINNDSLDVSLNPNAWNQNANVFVHHLIIITSMPFAHHVFCTGCSSINRLASGSRMVR